MTTTTRKSRAESLLSGLFRKYFSEDAQLELLPQSGSNRLYYRLKSKNRSVVGTYNEDKKENRAFVEFARHFAKKSIPVPEVTAADLENNCYLQSDLGNESLYNRIQKAKADKRFPEDVRKVYYRVLEQLADIQIRGAEGLDFSNAYPRAAFDRQSVLWDLNYFKYMFLKLAYVPFDEQLLENDFQAFADFIAQADSNYFLYRDFQSSNIMLQGDDVYFIDFQGGRRGALAYDLASLLYDAKAELPESFRNELKLHYIKQISKQGIDTQNFEKYYPAFVLVRVLQAMGAYGYRGLYERKKRFLKSIKPGVENLKVITSKGDFLSGFLNLKAVLIHLINSNNIGKITEKWS